jgi:hypothetical protein
MPLPIVTDLRKDFDLLPPLNQIQPISIPK